MVESLQRVKILPVILAGGVGSRLWPLSRANHPKPFIQLSDNQSLIQKTFNRAVTASTVNEVLTVTNDSLFFYTNDSYVEMGHEGVKRSFILEPEGRNSAPAIALAAHYAKESYGADTLLLVFPADHLIKHLDAFAEAVSSAVLLAQEGQLVTFGIEPTKAATGYGYIEACGSVVRRFVEKPTAEKAREYVESGNFFWNSGIFCMGVTPILEEMSKHCPDIGLKTAECMQIAQHTSTDLCEKIEIPAELFASIENISVDYALLERSSNVGVVPCNIGWCDIGSWLEFGALHPSDEAGNRIVGETVLTDVENCIINSGQRMVAGIGLKNLVIADTADAILVADRDRVQDVRLIVQKLKAQAHVTHQNFPKIQRPWGSYTVLQTGSGFKIKRLEVKPGARLSLQSHRHRSEHWVVVSGVATVINGESIAELQTNQSTYIPAGCKHRLENHAQASLIVIEVQCGDYLGEDDIMRYEDIYARTEGGS